ncbi:HNH endonuclease signature motif containing protein [soil metagenome]
MSAALDTRIGHPVAAAVTQIGAALDEVAEAPLWAMPGRSLLELTAAAGSLVGRVQELLVRLVGEVDARELPAELGATNPMAWVRHQLRVTPRLAKELVTVARATRTELSATGRALAAGRLTLAQAGVIVAAVQALPAGLDPATAVRAEADLIAQAKHFDEQVLARIGAHILTVVAPEIGEALEGERLAAQERRAFARRDFRITPDGHGTQWLRGMLDTESAAILRAALEPLARPRPTCADGPDLRTAGHRNADALVELARRALAGGAQAGGDLPDIGGERPHVAVSIPLAALIKGVGAATLDDGRRLSAAAARRLACDSHLIPAVFGGPSEVLDVGRTQRFCTGARRRALVLRDKGCAFPGCDRPPAWSRLLPSLHASGYLPPTVQGHRRHRPGRGPATDRLREAGRRTRLDRDRHVHR